VAFQRTPRGIYRFHDSGFYLHAVRRHRGRQRGDLNLPPERCAILGLYLMGSSGTLAQTGASDFDYWVVVKDEGMDAECKAAFQEKLRRITAWSREQYGQEVGLFTLTVSDVRENRFAALDEESAGSSQRTLLKEEFYRTFVMIAGKIPYWAVLPPGLSPGRYDHWVQRAQGATGSLRFIPEDYMDLGGLETIDRNECLGALLWQMFKACKSPFKSIVKAALIAHYYFFAGERGLLCEHIKSGFGLLRQGEPLTDPYAAVFQTALDFFQSTDHTEGLLLLRECVFLRLWEPSREGGGQRGEPSPKQRLLARYLAEWGWNAEKTARMAAFHQWPDDARLALEERIFQKLAFLYELIAHSSGASSPGSSMTPTDLTALKNRIAAALKRKPGKLPRCSAYFRTHVDGVSLELRGHPAPGGGEACWTVFHRPEDGPDSLVFQAPGLLGAMGWLLINGLYPPEGGFLSCRLDRLGLGPGRIRRLIREVHRFLSPLSATAEGLAGPTRWEKIAVLFRPAPRSGDQPMPRTEFLAVNSWGEFFFEAPALPPLPDRAALCDRLTEHLSKYLIETSGPPPLYRVFQLMDRPDEAFSGMMEMALASLREQAAGPGGTGALDTGEDPPLLDLI